MELLRLPRCRGLPQHKSELGGRLAQRMRSPSLGVVVDCGERSSLDPVEVELAAEVVDLVLDDAGRPADEDSVDRAGMLVERVDPYGPVAGHDAGNTGDAQAAFVEADLTEILDRRHCGIDQYQEGERVALTIGALVFGEVAPTFGSILENRQLKWHTDLRCG